MSTPKVSIVIPCLNEADSLAACLEQAKLGLSQLSEVGEVVVSDNGSTDGSVAIAERNGARVVRAAQRGYGAALITGIASARGEWIVMADGDASYDLSKVPKFIDKLREGNELVMGCRLPAGGGSVARGAMPFLHRWVGNPAFSLLARTWFGAPINDVNCGMRAFPKQFHDRLNLRCTGMEFAVEMVIKAALARARITEVPIRLHPDRRKAHAPHVRTVRDGWRTLRFFLLFSPRWLFGVPGLGLCVLGAIAAGVAFPGLSIGRVGFDVHTLLFAGFFILLGLQMLLFGVLAKAYAVAQGLLPSSPWLLRATHFLRLEAGILTGALCAAAGAALLAAALLQWRDAGFGQLDYSQTMRVAIPGVTMAAVGMQIVMASFLLGVFGLPHRPQPHSGQPDGHPRLP